MKEVVIVGAARTPIGDFLGKLKVLLEGTASAEDIDSVAKLGFNHPLGPLALVNLIGLDTVMYEMEVLYQGYGDTKYRPCPLLRKYVDAGWLGRKSGRCFYDYEAR